MKAELARGLARLAELGRLRPYPEQQALGADFCSNDYLGLAADPKVIVAGQEALAEFGAGGRASRLLAGGCPLHVQVEAAAAEWLQAEGALLFASGYQANLGLIASLAGRGDAIFSDRLNHASIIDGAALSRARVEIYEHLDPEDLSRRLERSRAAGRKLVLSESIFSMDGDAAPVDELLEVCARHDAWLILDEAHAVGLVGKEGRGHAASDHPRLLARMVGAGKALGVGGGLVLCDRVLRDHLVNHARSFVFSTAVVPALAGSLLAAIERCRSMDAERIRVLDLAARLAKGLELSCPAAAILPYVLGEDQRAVTCAEDLLSQGFHVRAVRPPTVPEGSARLRLVLHAHNRVSEVDALAAALRGKASAAVESPAPAPSETLFVVGTDTGVGKTVVSAAILRAWRRTQEARYWKPVQTGDENDSLRVAELSDADGASFPAPVWSLPLPASPHQAAAAAGVAIDPVEIQGRLAELRRHRDPLVVELAGGIHVPYALEVGGLRLQIDWLAVERPPLVLVARSGLGTLNHSLLTLESLRARALEPLALILVGPEHVENAAALRQLGEIEVIEMPSFNELTAESLDRWIDRVDLCRLLRTKP